MSMELSTTKDIYLFTSNKKYLEENKKIINIKANIETSQTTK